MIRLGRRRMTAASGKAAARRSQRPIPSAVIGLQPDDQAVGLEQDLIGAVQVEIDQRPGGDGRARPAQRQVLRLDQVA